MRTAQTTRTTSERRRRRRRHPSGQAAAAALGPAPGCEPLSVARCCPACQPTLSPARPCLGPTPRLAWRGSRCRHPLPSARLPLAPPPLPHPSERGHHVPRPILARAPCHSWRRAHQTSASAPFMMSPCTAACPHVAAPFLCVFSPPCCNPPLFSLPPTSLAATFGAAEAAPFRPVAQPQYALQACRLPAPPP
jgi:hypothetical protein